MLTREQIDEGVRLVYGWNAISSYTERAIYRAAYVAGMRAAAEIAHCYAMDQRIHKLASMGAYRAKELIVEAADRIEQEQS